MTVCEMNLVSYSNFSTLISPTDRDDNLQFTHCETAIACIDRGFGKRPSLHRTCSIGPVGDEPTNATDAVPAPPSSTPANAAVSSSSDSTRKRRKRADATTNSTDSSGTNTVLHNERRNFDSGTNFVCSYELAGQQSNENTPPDTSCAKLGDGETAEGNMVMNLTVCFCRADNCNVHDSEKRLKNQIIYAAGVCNGGQSYWISHTNQCLLIGILLLKIIHDVYSPVVEKIV